MTSSDRLVGGLRPPLLYGLTKRQWMVLDVVVVGLGLLAASFNLRPPHSASTPAPHGAVEIILVVLACGPIVLRRKWPIPVLAVVTAATAALVAVGRAPLVLIVMIGLASYTAANRAPRRWSIPALIGAEAVLGLALTIAAERHIAGNNGVQGLLPIAAAWFLGDSIATRRRYVAGLVEQAEQRRSAEAERARQAVREERVRIARELHDVVAHSLAVMTVQAGVGRRVMAEYPEEMRSALVSIEMTGRTAQNELRLVLGLFRDEGTTVADLAPAPGLSDIAELVEQVRSAGMSVELSSRGLDHELSPALGLSVFRIVQEALTNVVKHAPGAHAIVDLTISSQEVRVEITDDGELRTEQQPYPGESKAAPNGSQHGIVGMRERVSAFGGSLSAATEPGLGFRVVARMPVDGP